MFEFLKTFSRGEVVLWDYWPDDSKSSTKIFILGFQLLSFYVTYEHSCNFNYSVTSGYHKLRFMQIKLNKTKQKIKQLCLLSKVSFGHMWLKSLGWILCKALQFCNAIQKYFGMVPPFEEPLEDKNMMCEWMNRQEMQQRAVLLAKDVASCIFLMFSPPTHYVPARVCLNTLWGKFSLFKMPCYCCFFRISTVL